MTLHHQSVSGGFGNPVLDSQAVFHGLMSAFAKPGTLHAPEQSVSPPAPMNRISGLIALALCDADTPVWLDARYRDNPDIEEWLRFHTSAPVVASMADAGFAFLADASALVRMDGAARGTAETKGSDLSVLDAVFCAGLRHHCAQGTQGRGAGVGGDS